MEQAERARYDAAAEPATAAAVGEEDEANSRPRLDQRTGNRSAVYVKGKVMRWMYGSGRPTSRFHAETLEDAWKRLPED